MPDISIEVVFPAKVYHGTLDIFLDGFKAQLLNSSYWKPNRDFGRGFYTTISIEQARMWARAMQDKLNTGNPCVLEIALFPDRLPSQPSYRIFTGISLNWAQYIYEHRTVAVDAPDPCSVHADIIIGPMADADTGKIVANGVKLKKNADWFMDKITRNHANRRLDSLKLGNQIAFGSESLAPMLQLSGYEIYQGKRWRSHG
ncbi:DUF3990 domain-containing protein [Cohnella yongneupensis]|uniref:DUF3990 domain-containing protein n=1 Tax=Cohnella yongneupensis TaxID=425006 RepID=A0ABW0QTF9_9BACL